ncbi:hypothetical protein V6615_08315 [Oscillospiraceae bacterium PP1C4]
MDIQAVIDKINELDGQINNQHSDFNLDLTATEAQLYGNTYLHNDELKWWNILYQYKNLLSDKNLSYFLRYWWCFDTYSADMKVLENLFKEFGKKTMTPEDKIEFDKLPPILTVYRGNNSLKPGLSWSLIEEEAQRFGSVQRQIIEKEKALAYYHTHEKEIILPIKYDSSII